MDGQDRNAAGEGRGMEAELHTAKVALDDADAQLRGAAEARRAAADELDRVLQRMRQLYENERLRLRETLRTTQEALDAVEAKLRELDGDASPDASPDPAVDAADEGESGWREFLREQHLS